MVPKNESRIHTEVVLWEMENADSFVYKKTSLPLLHTCTHLLGNTCFLICQRPDKEIKGATQGRLLSSPLSVLFNQNL